MSRQATNSFTRRSDSANKHRIETLTGELKSENSSLVVSASWGSSKGGLTR